MTKQEKKEDSLKSKIVAGFEQIKKGESITISSKKEFIKIAKN